MLLGLANGASPRRLDSEGSPQAIAKNCRAWAVTRGQAVVELALGLMAFTIILMAGIHFAEVGFLSLKVQEAAVGTLWDSTAQRMHQLPGDFLPQAQLIDSGASQMGTARYGTQQGAVTQTFTQSSTVAVRCGPGGPGVLPVWMLSRDLLTNSAAPVYADVGSLACNAEAMLTPYGISERWARPLRVCAVGRPVGAACPGAFRVLLDDWGLAGPAESGESPLGNTAANAAYYRSAQLGFSNNAGQQTPAADVLANLYVGVATPPVDTSQFWMSFRGEESGFLETTNAVEGATRWATSPGANGPLSEYADSYQGRANGFLGTRPPDPPTSGPGLP
jgi:hypothetical protein